MLSAILEGIEKYYIYFYKTMLITNKIWSNLTETELKAKKDNLKNKLHKFPKLDLFTSKILNYSDFAQ